MSPAADRQDANPILNADDLALLEAMSDPAFVIDALTQCIVAANARTFEQTGYRRDEMKGMELGKVCSFDDPSRAKKALSDTPKSGGQSEPARLLRKDGSQLPVIFAAPPFHRNGRELILGMARPIVPEAAKTHESNGTLDRYQDLVENANDLIYSHDLKGKMTSLNRSALKVFGYTLDEALKLTVSQLVDEGYIATAQFNIAEKIKTGKTSPPYELLCRAKDGSPVWLEVSTRIISRDGVPVEIQGIGRDITERKHAATALKESQKKLQEQEMLLAEIIRQNPYAIAFWNPDGSFRQANEAFVRLYGSMPPPTYNLLNDPQVMASDFYDQLQIAFSGQTIDIDRIEYDLAKNREESDTPCPVIVSGKLFPVFDEAGHLELVVGYYENLAPKLEAEAAHEKLEAQLLQAQKMDAIGRLAGGVAHDFNNLLTGAIGYLDLIRSLTGKEIHGYIDKAETAVQRGCDLTKKLLAYARKSPLAAQAMDLNETAHEVAALIRQTVDRRIEIVIQPSTGPATISADPSQMSQILMNFCINARDSLNEKLTQPGAQPESWKPAINISTKIEQIDADYCKRSAQAREGMFVRLSVADNGMGIPEKIRERIFDPFFTTKPQGQGTGLGLATVLGIVKQHDGWVELYSEVGRHTVFHVLLPHAEGAALPLSTAAVSMNVRGGKETILLADDEEMIRELGKDMLEDKGYTVLVAVDGRDALDIFEREKSRIDLVVLDLTMPRMSGSEILPKLRAMKPGIKVIASSGYSYDDNWDNLAENGAAAFVQKPYTAIDFSRVVRQVLDS